MTFGNVHLPYGLFLAPLAGYTDTAMRRVCRSFGAEYTVSEMVSAKALCYHDKKTPLLARVCEEDLPSAVQIFGSDPASMAEAAKMVAAGMAGGVPPSAIDINMGCPVKKIVSAGDGSALMKNPALVHAIVDAVVKVVSLPVTVKIRAGWDEKSKNAVEVAKAAEAGGASLVAVHGRTRNQMYSGTADLKIIADVKNALQIPVVGNGDIDSAAAARRMLLETGCDGLMIGRGAVGNPFLFAEIRAAMDGTPYTPPTPTERVDTALRQLRLAIEEKGEMVAVTESRKQFAAYLHGLRGAAAVRGRINAALTYAEVEALARAFLAGQIE